MLTRAETLKQEAYERGLDVTLDGLDLSYLDDKSNYEPDTHCRNPEMWHYDEGERVLWSAPQGKGGYPMYENGVWIERLDNDINEIEI